jgi:CheY-like chemotaxis protein
VTAPADPDHRTVRPTLARVAWSPRTSRSSAVVLLDLQVPGQSGLDVLRSIRLRRPALPAIVKTAFRGDDMEQAVLDAGANADPAKP